MKASTEQELIEQCIANDKAAHNELYRRFARMVMGVALRYSRSREDAQDVVQDSFVKVFVSLKNYKGEGSFEGWIRRITVNTAINHSKKVLKFTQESDVTEQYDLSYDDHTLSNLSANEMLEMIQQLPPGFRTVFNLFAIEGYSHEEIGQMLGISEGTSKSQLSRARQSLASQIKTKYKNNEYNEHT